MWVEERLEKQVIPYSYAWKTLRVRGVVCAGGSDAPVEPPNPFLGMFAAIYRPKRALPSRSSPASTSSVSAPGVIDAALASFQQPLQSWMPKECLTKQEALHLYTQVCGPCIVCVYVRMCVSVGVYLNIYLCQCFTFCTRMSREHKEVHCNP